METDKSPTCNTTIFNRNSLIKGFKKLPIEEIDLEHFKSANGHRFFCKIDFIIFIDNNGKTKILKNRYGDSGIIN